MTSLCLESKLYDGFTVTVRSFTPNTLLTTIDNRLSNKRTSKVIGKLCHFILSHRCTIASFILGTFSIISMPSIHHTWMHTVDSLEYIPRVDQVHWIIYERMLGSFLFPGCNSSIAPVVTYPTMTAPTTNGSDSGNNESCVAFALSYRFLICLACHRSTQSPPT